MTALQVVHVFFSCTSGMFTGIVLFPDIVPAPVGMILYDFRYPMNTLQGTNISPKNGHFESMIFRTSRLVGYVNPLEGKQSSSISVY